MLKKSMPLMPEVALTFREHQKLGRHLREIDWRLSEIAGIISGQVPVPVVDKLQTQASIEGHLSALRIALEDILYEDFSNIPELVLRTVY